MVQSNEMFNERIDNFITFKALKGLSIRSNKS